MVLAPRPTRRSHPASEAACGLVVGDLPCAPRLWASFEVAQRGLGLGWEGALQRAREAGGGAGVGPSGCRTHTYTLTQRSETDVRTSGVGDGP